MNFCPHMIPAGMVGHPIYNHFKTHFVCKVCEAFKIGQCTKFVTDAGVIAAGVLTPQTTLFILFRNGCNWHKPQGANAHLL